MAAPTIQVPTDGQQTYTVRLRHLKDVRSFVLIPSDSAEDLSRCIVSAFPAIIAGSKDRPENIRITSVVASNGLISPLYVLAKMPWLFVGPPYAITVMGERHVVTTTETHALPHGWEMRMEASGKAYFINHNTKQTTWRDPRLPNAAHPDPSEAAAPTYHSVTKIRELQKETRLGEVTLENLLTIFKREATLIETPTGRGAGVESSHESDVTYTDDSSDTRALKRRRARERRAARGAGPPGDASSTGVSRRCLNREQFARVWDLLLRGTSLGSDEAAHSKAMVDRLFNLFDRDHNGVVDYKEFCFGLSLLAKATPEARQKVVFDAMDTDHSGKITQDELLTYLRSVREVFTESSGVSPVGHTDDELTAVCAECFRVADTDQDGAISWPEFQVWARTNPPALRWMHTLEKFEIADSISHPGVRCNGCHMQPLIGLRYRCLDCFDVDLCAECYANKRTFDRHLATHRIKEYTRGRTLRDSVQDVLHYGSSLFTPTAKKRAVRKK